MNVNPADRLPVFATSTPSKLGQARTLTIGEGEHSITARTCRVGTGWFHALKGDATKHTVFIDGKKTTVYIPTKQGVQYVRQWRNLREEVPIVSKEKIHQLIEEVFQEKTTRLMTDSPSSEQTQGVDLSSTRYTAALPEKKQRVEETIQHALQNLRAASTSLQSELTKVRESLSRAHSREASITPETTLQRAETLRDEVIRAYTKAQELARRIPKIEEEKASEGQALLNDFRSTYPSENIQDLQESVDELTRSQKAMMTPRKDLEKAVEELRLAAESASHKC